MNIYTPKSSGNGGIEEYEELIAQDDADVEGESCPRCVFNPRGTGCVDSMCMASERTDGREVVFVRKT
jgi:hypothetical protein